MSALQRTLDPSSRRAAQIARIEALRREGPVSRYAQRLIEPAAWGWLILTFIAASVAMAGVAAVAEQLPRELVIVLTGGALFLSVVLVDVLFAPMPTPPPAPTDTLPAPGRPLPATKIASSTIRIALIVLVLGGAALTALVLVSPDTAGRLAAFIEDQRHGIERSLRADTEQPSVRGLTRGSNWHLLERDGRYIAVPLAEAKRRCAGLGAGWQTPRREDFDRLVPPPNDPSTLHVWVSRAFDRAEPTASSAQIVAGSWQPTGFLLSEQTARDQFHVLCVRPGG